MNWYVIRVVTGKEKKTKEAIEKQLQINNLMSNVSQILIASKKVMQMRNGKKYIIEKNDFPGYVLIQTELLGDIINIIKNVPNVLGFLGSGKPEPLRQSEINRIIGRQEEKEIAIDKYFIDEIVTIVDGPFASFLGTVTFVDDKKKIVKVNVKIFGRDVPVDLTYLQIEKS